MYKPLDDLTDIPDQQPYDAAQKAALAWFEHPGKGGNSKITTSQISGCADKGFMLLPLRPGAIAELTVKNYDKRPGVLTIGKDKAGRDRKVSLPNSTVVFFNEQSADKLSTAPLIAAVMAASAGKMPGSAFSRRRQQRPNYRQRLPPTHDATQQLPI